MRPQGRRKQPRFSVAADQMLVVLLARSVSSRGCQRRRERLASGVVDDQLGDSEEQKWRVCLLRLGSSLGLREQTEGTRHSHWEGASHALERRGTYISDQCSLRL